MQKLNAIAAVLIVAIPVGVAVNVAANRIIKAIHRRWKHADLFKGLKGE